MNFLPNSDEEKKMFKCEECSKEYTRKQNLNKHIRLGHAAKVYKCKRCHHLANNTTFPNQESLTQHYKTHVFKCEFCGAEYNKNYNLNRHLGICVVKHTTGRQNENDRQSDEEENVDDGEDKDEDEEENEMDDSDVERQRQQQQQPANPPSVGNVERKYCKDCKDFFRKSTFSSHLISGRHIEKVLKQVDENCYIYKTALRNRLIVYRIKNTSENDDDDVNINIASFMGSVSHCVLKILELQQSRLRVLKFRCKLIALYSKSAEDGEVMMEQNFKHFHSKFRVLTQGDDISELYRLAILECVANSDEFQEEASGWTIIRILFLDIELAKADLVGGSSFIPTPKFIANKKCCINVHNFYDSKCFLYAILSVYYKEHIPHDRRNSVDLYRKLFKTFNTTGIEFPVSVKDISKFERMNSKKRISINVYAVDMSTKTIVGPLYLTKNVKRRHIDLLLLEKHDRTHYIGITNFAALIRRQNSKHNTKLYICKACLLNFRSAEELNFHNKIGCGKTATILPEKEDAFLEFKNHRAKQFHPFVIYADLESILEQYSGAEPNPKYPFEINTQLHTPVAFAYSIKSLTRDFNISELRIYTGPDCIDVFIDTLYRDIKYIGETYYRKAKEMEKITDEIRIRLVNQTQCIFCDKTFQFEDRIVLDHDHITGLIRGKAHSLCNIQCGLPRFEIDELYIMLCI